ncbi:MAG: sugar phosphate isomerase/epimerase family protein [Terriglobia bacterium]
MDRRGFLQASVVAGGVSVLSASAKPVEVGEREPGEASSNPSNPAPVSLPESPSKAGPKPLRLGIIIGIGSDPDAAIAKVHTLGLPTCQVYTDSLDAGLIPRLKTALDHYQVEATALVASGPGPAVYDFYQGPATIGLVPRQYRAERVAFFKKASDFAKQCGLPAVQTHCGFLPENPNDPVYQEVVEAIREVASYCKQNGQNFRYETGQETPITLLRAIHDVGLDNQGINFDLANLILYDKANPVDALPIIGPYVQGIHAKDGLFPTDPRNLGQEVPIGQGKVDFRAIIDGLKKLNYQGAITIEREISGPQQFADIRRSIGFLESLIGY